MHHILIRLACVISLAFSITIDVAHAQQSSKLTPINYGNIVLTASTWPFLIAEQEGFFVKESIDFKRIIGGNTTATTQALVGGSTDIAQMNLVNLLGANSAGADLVVIAGDSTVPIYTLIVHPSIKSYADLKGKRLAVTGPTDPLNYIFARMLAANGLTPADYELIGLGGAPQRLAAVQNGGVAGALVNQPSDFIALASGFNSLGLSTDYVDNFQYTIAGARRDWAQKNRPTVVRFLRAYLKACEFFYDPKNKEAAVRALAERTKSDKEEAEKTYALYMKTKKTIPRDGGVDVQGARKVAESWKDFGLPKAPAPVDSIIDLSYLAEARK
ncbi:MAG TPA: ABC transporter substrate-binding protein [Candidatus Eisenbacteria bacterium]|jgi:NitT/TauT family transport system substrate-binding protein|nr:ABC transporter substrate-binding protein [Candidatus Eisenbacteria bacterium]